MQGQIKPVIYVAPKKERQMLRIIGRRGSKTISTYL